MDPGRRLIFALFSCALVGILMLMLVVLAFLRSRHKLGDQAGVLIIAAVLLVLTMALAVGNY